MNSGVLKAAREGELSVVELKKLKQDAADLTAAFAAQIMFLKHEINWRDELIDEQGAKISALTAEISNKGKDAQCTK
jgi:hypothetical protein